MAEGRKLLEVKMSKEELLKLVDKLAEENTLNMMLLIASCFKRPIEFLKET